MNTTTPAASTDLQVRVLVADDSDADVELEIRELRKHGFDVTWHRVETAGEFQAALANAHWDVVLSDYSMPSFSGLEALRYVRELDPELPFILVSGVIDQETAVEAIRAGANDYLLKDRLRRLGAAVERELAAADARRRQKEMEAERERMREQLFQAQKMESVGRLAGGIAHDFNNMLGVIIGHAQLAMLQEDLNDEVRADLEEILKAAERSANHTRQLLAFARRQTIRPRVVQLNETVGGMLSMLRRLIGEDVELTWRPGHNLWRIRMDPSQIDQILANLVTNARDAIGGVGQIVIETSNVVLDARPGREIHDFVLLTVSDNGRGMDEHTIKHVFEPFFTTKEVGQGTGLGLAMVHGVVEQNQGFIGVTSVPGEGTTFKIYLPRAEGTPEKPARDEKVEVPRGSGQTILIVEDERPLLNLAATSLRRLGYDVLTAGSAEDALHVNQTHGGRLELLVVDVVMPRMNGSDLAAMLRRTRPDLPCLFMSGYTAEVIAARGVLEDGVHFLQKPFTLEELGRKVHDLVARRGQAV